MLLSVKDLTVKFPAGRGAVTAVDGVSFDAGKGEILAIVGESGSGKSAAALSVMRLVPSPGRISGGPILYKGADILKLPEKRMQSLRGDEISMVFQEPMTSLNPAYSVGRQLTEAITRHTDMSKRAARDHAVDMLRRVGIPSPESRAGSFPHEMSGGMRQRVMIAMALSCRPELLIADEPTTALDVTTQAQIMDLLFELRGQFRMGVLLITHDLGVVAEAADRVAVMYCGRIVEEADVRELYGNPLHPYTKGLIASVPRLDRDAPRLPAIRGAAPDPFDLPSGCPFSARCDCRADKCGCSVPALMREGGHGVRCYLYHGEMEAGA